MSTSHRPALTRALFTGGLSVLGALGGLGPANAALPGRMDGLSAPEMAHRADRRVGVQPGVIHRLRLAEDRHQHFYLYVPKNLKPGAPLVVTVHGISRNAREHVARFAALAEQAGSVVVAPLYTDARFSGYQRLAADERNIRPDTVLLRVAAEAARLSGADDRQLYLFGYSGGGQFVHRFALAHPGRVARYAVGAAGWYTFPDESRRFPLGLRQNPDNDTGVFALDAFLRIPGVVLVGELDDEPDAALRTGKRLQRLQGADRLTRGRSWVEAVSAAAQTRGLPPPVRFEILPGSPHSFARSMENGALGERVFRHFFEGQDHGSEQIFRALPSSGSISGALACIVPA